MLDGYVDQAAKAAGFKNIESLVSYVGDEEEPAWDAIARKFKVWRTQFWKAAIVIMNETMAGDRLPPESLEALVAELPAAPVTKAE